MFAVRSDDRVTIPSRDSRTPRQAAGLVLADRQESYRSKLAAHPRCHYEDALAESSLITGAGRFRDGGIG